MGKYVTVLEPKSLADDILNDIKSMLSEYE